MKYSNLSRLVFLTLYCALGCVARVSAQEDKQIALAGAAQGVVNSPATARSVSLPDCFNLADQHNQEILSASWTLTIARAAIKIASAVPNPQLALQTGFGNSFQYLFDGQTQDFYITQQFQTAGKRSKKMDVARANYGLAELQLDALRFNVHNRVRRAYAELAAAEAFEALVESQRQVGLRLLDIAKKRNAAGKAPMSEVLQANLNVLQFDTQRNQAQGRLQQDSALLTQIIGEKPEHIEVIDVDDNGIFKLSVQRTDIVPQATRETPRLDALINTAFRYRPDLKAAVQQVFANEKAVTLARTKKVPDLFIGIGGTYSTFTRNQPAGLNAVGNWIGTGIFMNVTAEAPLFYQYQGEVQQALGTVRQSQRQVELLRSQIATDTVTAYNEVNVARENIIEFQKNQLPTAAEVAKLARRSYEVGQSDLTSAIIAQQQYQQTLSSYFNAVVTYQTAWADLEKAVGAPLKMQ
ncbi:MAG: TolC family protein [Candidatus Obscuribacterales bacterium]|nr:TolC family protein [Candidatus Obscuribacterales bacterium]